MAYVPFDAANPSGSNTGPNVPINARANERAVRDALLMGAFRSFDYSQSGGTARQPTSIFFKSGAIWVKGTVTWGTTSGEKYNPTAITWELSLDTGGTWDTIAAQTFTYDSSGNLTAMTNASAMTSYLFALFGRVRLAEEAQATHAALTTGAHGTGTMALQAASAVAITGGSIATETQNLIMPAGAALGTKNGAFNIDLSLSHYFTVTIQAGAVATFTNKPASGTVKGFTIEITNGGLVADQVLFPGCKAPGGALALSTSGTDLLHGLIRDGSTIQFTGVSPAEATLS